jgi:hypothetical protein
MKDRSRQYNDQTGQTMIYKALYIQIKIDQMQHTKYRAWTQVLRKGNLATNLVICHDRGKDWIVITANGTY